VIFSKCSVFVRDLISMPIKPNIAFSDAWASILIWPETVLMSATVNGDDEK